MYISLRQRATSAIKWSILGHLASRAIPPVVLVLLARVLAPQEYGILEIAILVITLMQLVQELGLVRAIVQTESDAMNAASSVFWLNLALSGVGYAGLLAASPWIAALFHQALAEPVLRIAGLQLPILALGTVQLAIAQRDLNYRLLFISQLGNGLAMAAGSAVLIMLGSGLWAFVISSLAGSAVQVVLLWSMSRWRPALDFDLHVLGRLLRFGSLATLETLQGWMLNYGDNLVVGYFLGSAALGMYGLAFNIAVHSFALLLTPVNSVAFASLSRLQGERDELIRAFTNLVEVSALLILPMGVGIASIARPFSQLFLGERWGGIVPIIQLLALFPGISHILVINPELYKAIGRPDIMPRLLLAVLLYSAPVYIIGAQFGLRGFTIARISVTVATFPIHLLVASRVLNIRVTYLWFCIRKPLVSVVAMSALTLGLIHFAGLFKGTVGWMKLGGIMTAGAATYGIFLWLLDRDLLARALRLARQAI